MQAVSISQIDFVSWFVCVECVPPTVDSTSLQYLLKPFVSLIWLTLQSKWSFIRRSYIYSSFTRRFKNKISLRYHTVDQVFEYPLKQLTMNFIFDTVYQASPVQSSPVQSSLVPLTPSDLYQVNSSGLRNTNDQERGNGSNYQHGSHYQERSNHYASNERTQFGSVPHVGAELLANYHCWRSLFQYEVEQSMDWFKEHINELLYDATNDYCITMACPLILDCPLLSVSSGFLRTTGYTQDEVEEKFHRNFLVQSEMREKTTVCNFRILILMLY